MAGSATRAPGRRENQQIMSVRSVLDGFLVCGVSCRALLTAMVQSTSGTECSTILTDTPTTPGWRPDGQQRAGNITLQLNSTVRSPPAVPS